MSGRHSRGSHAAGGVGALVRPHSACDSKTVMESLVHFLQDVVTVGAESSAASKPGKREGDAILWARFETCDLNELGLIDADSTADKKSEAKSDGGFGGSLLLTLGYDNGAQIWSVASSGQAEELLSLKNGPIKALKLLPQPLEDSGVSDRFSMKRPLLAISESSSSSPLNSNLKFVSLSSGEDVHVIAYKQPIQEVLANRKVIVATFVEKFVVLDASSLSHRFWVGSCFPSSGPNLNPVALSSRWLAYADTRFVSHHQSYGGVSSATGQSVASTVISAAKTLSKGLTALGETVASSLSGGVSPTGHPIQNPQQHRGSPSADGFGGIGSPPPVESPHVPGVISVVDAARVDEEKFGVTPDTRAIEGLVAHFVAHANEPIAAVAWNQSGQLLFTADRLGHCFHIFKILAHPLSSSFASVHHLYTLRRGETTSKVQDVAFSLDSRWVAVSTFRGTTHVFPITPYGGPVTTRTHLCPKVVNRASRFHKSAGIDEISSSHSPSSNPLLLGSSPSSATPHLSPDHHPNHHSHPHYHHSSHNGNPRVNRPPTPTLVHSVAQIKQPLTLANAIPGSGGTNPSAKGCKSGIQSAPTHHSHHHHRGSQDNLDAAASICVATVFGESRGWLGQHATATPKSESPYVDALFVMGWHGGLLEYILEPHPAGYPPPSPTSHPPSSPTSSSSSSSDFPSKIGDETRIELVSSPRARWMLRRLPTAPEFPPPLPAENPLLSAASIAAAAMKRKARVRAATWSLANRCEGGLGSAEIGGTRSSEMFLGLRGPGEGEDRGSLSNAAAAAANIERRGSEGDSSIESDEGEDDDDAWLSQVEMLTYEGPHRRLWMGPQFAFKVVNPSTTSLTPSSSALFADVEPFARGATIATLDEAAGSPNACSPAVVSGGAAPAQASAGGFDSLMLDVNLESLKVGDETSGRSNPVDVPPSSNGHRRPRRTSNKSDASESRRRQNSGHDSLGSGSGNVVEVFGSWPDSARPELTLGSGVGIDSIGEEISAAAGMPPLDDAAEQPSGQEKLLQESLADAMLEAALGVAGSGVGDLAARGSSDGGSSKDASGEFFIASEDLVMETNHEFVSEGREIRVDEFDRCSDVPDEPHRQEEEEDDFGGSYGKGFSLSNEEPFSLTIEAHTAQAETSEVKSVKEGKPSFRDIISSVDPVGVINVVDSETKVDAEHQISLNAEKDVPHEVSTEKGNEVEGVPSQAQINPNQAQGDPNDFPFLTATGGKKKGKKKKK